MILKRLISSLNNVKSPCYDVIVIGGGHAGTEACAAAARTGAKTLLVTHKLSTIGAMSCNPSFGGIGKGHLMKEIDALDGVCGRICDLSGIHYNVLNKSKGPAVWGYRAQIDRDIYKSHIQHELFNTPNLSIIEASVEDLILNNSNITSDHKAMKTSCNGIILGTGEELRSKAVVLTAGTFLRGEIHLGLDVKPAGRMGDDAAVGIAKTIEYIGFKMGRLKTGTPPRIEKKDIDFSLCVKINADDPPLPFSFLSDRVFIKPEDQIPCYITHTNADVNEVVKKTQHLNHHIKETVTGPRYCPSLESKVLRFSHPQQVWLEPEGIESEIIYPQGLSCTMPPEYQQELINCIPCLKNTKIFQPGYGVEYDYINPTEINNRLETNKVSGLYFAGQINGTTGYEEAAAQGLVAGVNAACKILGKPPLIINRCDGYIGILIEDLTTQGTLEPYRMFTARADVKTKFRPDNADIRLTEIGYKSGCVSENRYLRTIDLIKQIEDAFDILNNDIRKGSTWRSLLGKNVKLNTVKQSSLSALEILRSRCNVSIGDLSEVNDMYKQYATNQRLASQLFYDSYYYWSIRREEDCIEEVKMNLSIILPDDIDYMDAKINLKQEARDKLNEVRPNNIEAASRIPGVTVSSLISLYYYCRRATE